MWSLSSLALVWVLSEEAKQLDVIHLSDWKMLPKQARQGFMMGINESAVTHLSLSAAVFL